MTISKTKYTSQYIDNMSFDESLGVSMVEIIGADGRLVYSDPLAKYQSAGLDISSNPYYFGYIALDGSWYIKKLDTTSGTTYSKGDADYSTAWAGKDGLSYGDFNVIFS